VSFGTWGAQATATSVDEFLIYSQIIDMTSTYYIKTVVNAMMCMKHIKLRVFQQNTFCEINGYANIFDPTISLAWTGEYNVAMMVICEIIKNTGSVIEKISLSLEQRPFFQNAQEELANVLRESIGVRKLVIVVGTYVMTPNEWLWLKLRL
jgi:hypothetical protein